MLQVLMKLRPEHFLAVVRCMEQLMPRTWPHDADEATVTPKPPLHPVAAYRGHQPVRREPILPEQFEA